MFPKLQSLLLERPTVFPLYTTDTSEKVLSNKFVTRTKTGIFHSDIFTEQNVACYQQRDLGLKSYKICFYKDHKGKRQN